MAGIPGYSPKGAYASQPTYYPSPYSHLEPGRGRAVQQPAPRRLNFEDEESLSEAETVPAAHVDFSLSRAQGLACIGMLLVTLIVCVPLIAHFGPSLPFAGGEAQHSDTAHGLFRSQELANVATDNVLAAVASGRHETSRRLQEAPDREQVLAAVNVGFQNIDDHIRVQYPAVHRGLCEARLSAAQREAVMSAMRHMKDPRVQQLGRSLLQAAAPGIQSKDSFMLKVAVLKHVQSFFREARALRDEIIPASLREQQHTQANGLVDAADVDQMQLLRSFNKWYGKAHPMQPQAQPARRRLMEFPFPGNFSFSKTNFTVSGPGLMLGGMANKSVEYAAGQAQAFFHQIGGYFSYLGLDTVVDNIFGGQEFQDFKTCAKKNIQTLDPSSEMHCFSTFANTAYDEIMNTNFSKGIVNQAHSMFPTSQPMMEQQMHQMQQVQQVQQAAPTSWSPSPSAVQPLPTSSGGSGGAPSWWTSATQYVN